MWTYSVARWDAVLPTKDGEVTYPMIYVVPDQDFIKYAELNQNALPITISGTDSEYDGHSTIGIIHNSGFYPNYRPNFYNTTKYYVIVLMAPWLGYPPKNGTISIQRSDDAKLTAAVAAIKEKPFVPPKAIEWYTSTIGSSSEGGNLSSKQLSILFICLIVLLVVVVAVSLLYEARM